MPNIGELWSRARQRVQAQAQRLAEAENIREEARRDTEETRRLCAQVREEIHNITEVRPTEYGNSVPMENPPTIPPGERVEASTPEDFMYISSETPITSTTATSNTYTVDEGRPDYPDIPNWNWNMETEEWEAAEIDNSCNGKCGLILCEECMEDPKKAISF